MGKFSRVERARQFMPFAALKGFESLIADRENIKAKRRIPSEEKCRMISRILASVTKGSFIELLYYDTDSYKRVSGRVCDIDCVFGRLVVGESRVSFEDVFDIYSLDSKS